MLSYSLLFSKKNLATNSPDSQRKVGSDEFCSIPSDSNSKSPTAKLLVEKELESLREQAVARNVREKYSGSHSFMSPEETIAYLGKQRKRTFNSPAPPNTTSYDDAFDPNLFPLLHSLGVLPSSVEKLIQEIIKYYKNKPIKFVGGNNRNGTLVYIVRSRS